MRCVLDSSAVLAVLHEEKGHEAIAPRLPGGVLSTVNLTEILQKVWHYGLELPDLEHDLEYMEIEMVDFTRDRARAAADLWAEAPKAGLSLGDRACLALARELALPAVTTDRRWAAQRHLEIHVEVIR